MKTNRNSKTIANATRALTTLAILFGTKNASPSPTTRVPRSTVTALLARAPEFNARARTGHAPMALWLSKLGPEAVEPILEELSRNTARRADISDESRTVLARDLIESLGLLKDERAFRLLSRILADPSTDDETLRTTAEAIARLDVHDTEPKLLEALASAQGSRALAQIQGMGECRHRGVVEAFQAKLASATDDETVRALARALGRAGNAWAWSTRADRTEEHVVRETAARALIDAFVRKGPTVRGALSNALLVVDAPQTLSLLTEARERARSTEDVAALTGLAARLTRNPARMRSR
jgi:hypothetical protein